MLGSRARAQIVVALRLVIAQRADALHVAQHHRLAARQRLFVDAECLQHFGQLVRRMRAMANQLVQILR
jgi:hypothetical protein